VYITHLVNKIHVHNFTVFYRSPAAIRAFIVQKRGTDDSSSDGLMKLQIYQ
jgi:hypothetical protein